MAKYRISNGTKIISFAAMSFSHSYVRGKDIVDSTYMVIKIIMLFDTNNKINQLCAKGMEIEVQQPAVAKALFLQAWQEATTDIEKITAAHYVARHQASIQKKLCWDKTALEFALKANDERIAATYTSLYLNIAKCYEDLHDFDNAKRNYEVALSYTDKLPADGYGQMITSGIKNGLARVSAAHAEK